MPEKICWSVKWLTDDGIGEFYALSFGVFRARTEAHLNPASGG